METKQITIKDIAQKAGVAVSTVSRVLNGKDRVSPETRQRVQQIIDEYDYVQNAAAVSVVKRKTNMIGVIIPEIQNPFNASIVYGVDKVCKTRGYNICVFSTDDKVADEERLIRSVVSPLVDGIIAITCTDGRIYLGGRKPVVLVDRGLGADDFDEVVIDNMGGMHRACDYLIKKGHRKIAYISGPLEFTTGLGRLQGFRGCMEEHGIPIDEDNVYVGDWFVADGRRATQKILERNSAGAGVTAILCSNNLICKGCIEVLHEAKVAIGEDISLLGFDENDLVHYTTPKITYVARPTYEMGEKAAEMLLEKIASEKSYLGQKMVMRTRLIEQGSVKDLNRK